MTLVIFVMGLLMGYLASEFLPFGWLVFAVVMLLIIGVFYRPRTTDTP